MPHKNATVRKGFYLRMLGETSIHPGPDWSAAEVRSFSPSIPKRESPARITSDKAFTLVMAGRYLRLFGIVILPVLAQIPPIRIVAVGSPISPIAESVHIQRLLSGGTVSAQHQIEITIRSGRLNSEILNTSFLQHQLVSEGGLLKNPERTISGRAAKTNTSWLANYFRHTVAVQINHF